MKHKFSKRSTSNKQFHHRSYQTQTRHSSIPIDNTQSISLNQIDLTTATTVDLESHTLCLKPNVYLRSQKLLKRDLLRCSNQRPSLLGVQTLQPLRHHHHHHHHHSKQIHSVASSSSSSSSIDRRRRRRSLSVNSHTFYATIDRIGPWPDISINRLRSDGNDLLRPLKNFRNIKNPRLFSPKYYDTLSGNTNKFQFHSSNRTYIEEYRKQKGYLLTSPHSPQKQITSISLSSLKKLDDDQISANGTFSGGRNSSARERTDLTLSTRGLTRSANDLMTNNNNNNNVSITTSSINQINIFPALSIRNNNYHHLRSMRHNQQNQPINLPAITKTSFRYLNSINSVDKAYRENKKTSNEDQSKLYLFDGRPKKRLRPVHKITLDFELPAARS